MNGLKVSASVPYQQYYTTNLVLQLYYITSSTCRCWLFSDVFSCCSSLTICCSRCISLWSWSRLPCRFWRSFWSVTMIACRFFCSFYWAIFSVFTVSNRAWSSCIINMSNAQQTTSNNGPKPTAEYQTIGYILHVCTILLRDYSLP